MHMTVITPAGYEPKRAYVEIARARAAATGADLTFSPDPAAVSGADAIYTDTWASMGQESEAAARREIFRDYQVNDALLEQAGSDVLVLHCLPAHRGEEITDAVMDGPHSAVFDEAENRLHVQKALLALLIA
jgi:ornithine carbamoyltransferase